MTSFKILSVTQLQTECIYSITFTMGKKDTFFQFSWQHASARGGRTQSHQSNKSSAMGPGTVWRLSQFYLLYLLFCKEKSLLCLKGKSMTPRWGNASIIWSSQQLPCPHYWPLKGFFELTRFPLHALCVVSGTAEIQGQRQVCRTRRRGPRTLSKTVDRSWEKT